MIVVPAVGVDFNKAGEAISIPSRAFVTPATTDQIDVVLRRYGNTIAANGQALAWVTSEGGDTVAVFAGPGILEMQFLDVKKAIDESLINDA